MPTLNLASTPTLAPPAIPEHARIDGLPWFAVDRIGSKCVAHVFGEIGLSSQTAADFIAAVADAEHVTIVMDSLGGDINCAFKIHDALIGRDVELQILGNCFSSAVVIALAGSKIRMRSDARMMVHKACAFAFGSAEELACSSRFTAKLNVRLADLLKARTEQPDSVVSEWLSKDTYFTAAEALAAGLVDEVFDPEVKALPAITLAAAPETGPTDDERLLMAFLTAAGPFECRSKAGLARELSAWLNSTVKEIL
jgi:ATP-dependent protease ClpP protease subunit